MLSVIIPTVQKKLEVLKRLTELLEKDNSVSEIFVINNKPEVSLDLRGDKLKIYTPEENLYVNPSWNFGVSKIKNDNFVLMNDDLLVCRDFCSQIVKSEVFNDEKTGLIGVSTGSINQFSNVDYIEIPPENASAPVFKPLNRYLGTGDWGIAIFGKKHNYYEIPDDLKIIYGDNYLIYQNLKNNKQNYSVSNLPVNHIHSSSSASREFSQIVAADIKNSAKYFKKPEESQQNKALEDFEIEYKNTVCVIRLNQNKSSIFFKYRSDTEIYPDNILKTQLFALIQDRQLALKIIDTIKSDQNKSC